MWKNSNENQEDWSLRSNSTPDTRDVWTDTEKEHDDLLMMSERSDSGVTSPHSHHQLDDRTSLPSPCDLSMIDSIPNDDVRKRIIAMTKRPCYDDDDKLCLLQILSLLNNLEALSQDQEITGEFLSLEINQSRRSGSTENYSVLAEETPNRLKNQARIVATVQPYSSGLDCEEPIKPRYTALPNTQETCLKRKHLSTSNLQESGVFDTDSTDCTTQATQTCPEDFPVFEPRSGDLTAEIQKLNKFRERIEEVVTAKKSSVVNLLSPEQSRLQYYKDRLELLENKILVYESSGDLQVRRLAERLQREIHLESLVKQLSGKLEELEKENRTLDEERCEFEEAENDTRLRLQRLEVEFEILNQRNIELEMSREALQSKLKDTKRQVVSMEDQIEEYQLKIEEVESSKNDLSCTMEKIKNAMPVLMLYHEFQLRQGLSSGEILTPKITNDGISISSGSSENSTEKELRQKVSELTNRVKELEKGIDELKLAYNETLENADNLWAQMEKDYKDRLQQMELTEQNMKVKIGQLEERIIKDSQYAQERIGQMEDSEYSLKSQICKLNRENKELLKKYTSLVDEYNTLKEDCQNLKSYLEGPAAAVLEKERSKVKILEDDLNHSQEVLKSLEAMHKNDSSSLKAQVTKANKELEHVKVTNHELYEEVSTLETRLREMRKVKAADDETIKSLSQELRAKQIQLNNLQQMIKHGSPPTLAQELGTSKRICLGDPKPLKKATFELQNSIKNFEGCKNCMSANPQVVDMCKGVKRLADSLLDDAERGKSPSKTEEVSGNVVQKDLRSKDKYTQAPSLILQALVTSKNSPSTEILYFSSSSKSSRQMQERNSRASTVENILGGIIKEEGDSEKILHEGEMSGVVGESEGDRELVDSESLIASSHKSSGRSDASHITGVLSKLMDLKRKSASCVSDVSYFSALFPTTKPLGFGQTRSCVVGSGQKKINDKLRETPKVGSSKTMADLRDVEQQQCSSSQKILQSFHDNEESVSKEPENINDLINDTTEKDCSTFVLREISSKNSTNCSELGEQVESVGEIFQLNDDKSNDVIDSIEETPKTTDILEETIENTEIDHGKKLEEISTSVSGEVSKIESCKTLINPDDDRVIEVIEDAPKITENLEESIEDLVADRAINSKDSVITVRKNEIDIVPDEFFEAMKENIISQLPEESIFDEKISLIGTDRTEYTNPEDQPATIHTLSSNPSKSDIMFTAREAFTPKSFQMDIQKDHQFLTNIPDNQAKENKGQMKDETSDNSKEWFFGDKAKFNYDMFTKKKSNDQENDQGEIKNMTEEIISSVIECLSICPSGNHSEKVRKQLMQISSKNESETCQSISDDEQLSTFTDILNIKRDLFEIQEKIPETSMMFEITRTLGCLIRDDKCKDFCGSKIRELTKVIRIFVNGWKKEIDPDLVDVEVSKTQVITIETRSERSESDDCQEVETKTIVTAASYQTINSTGLNSLWETVTEISQMDNKPSGEIEQQTECVSALEDNLKELANFIDQLNSKEQKQSGMRTVSSIMNLNKSYRSEGNKKKPDDVATKKTPPLRRGNRLSNRSNKNTCSYRSSGDDRSIVGMLESARSYINYFYNSLDDCSRNNFRVTYRNISSALESLRMMNESTDLSPKPDDLRI